MSSLPPDFPQIPFTDKKPFFGLNVVFVGQILFVILGFILGVFLLKDVPNVSKESLRGFVILLLLKDALIALLLWRGVNWVRWLFIVWISVALWKLSFPILTHSVAPDFERICIVANHLWTIGVGIWLLLPGVARHFVSRKSDTETEFNAG